MDRFVLVQQNYIKTKEFEFSPREIIADITEASGETRGTVEILQEEVGMLKDVIGNLVEILLSKNLMTIEDINYLSTSDWGRVQSVGVIRIERVKEK